MRIRAFALLIVFAINALSAPCTGLAQRPDPWTAVMLLPPDVSIEVDLHTGERTRGQLNSAGGQELTLESDRKITTVPRSSVKRVRRRIGHNAPRGALFGLGIGAGSGALVGARMNASDDPVVLPLAILAGGLGAAFGSLFGVFIPKWETVYEAPAP